MRKKTLCFLLLALLAPHILWAQDGYPNRPVTLLVPFAVGGDADQFGRALAQSLEKLPQPPTLRLENRPGQSGVLASLAVRQANADGYTLLVGRVGPLAIQPAIDPSTPYQVRDFTVLAILERDPLICSVRADSPYQSARELLAAIRKRPGEFSYSTSGSGTILNLAAQYLMVIAGLPGNAAHGMHFNGGQEAVAALADGKVDFTCGVSSTVGSLINGGKLRGLFTTATGRMEAFPLIPNAREAGYRGMSNIVGWTALMGPPGLDADAIRYWKTALRAVSTDPAWLATNVRLGGQPAIRLIAHPEQYVQDQYALYRRLALSKKIQP